VVPTQLSGYIWDHPWPHYGGEARAWAIGTDRVTDKSLEKKMGEVLSAQGKEMSEIKSNLAALSTQMAAMMEEVKKNRIDRYRHSVYSLFDVFRSTIGGISSGLFICCPLA
jgi:hypothetical protein